jgi:hypothetical protein
VDDTAMRLTARVVRDVGADVIGVVEAENRPALKGFSDALLPLEGGEPYAQVMLIDGNDPARHRLRVVTRERFPIAAMLSHVDAVDDGGPVFSAIARSTTWTRRATAAVRRAGEPLSRARPAGLKPPRTGSGGGKRRPWRASTAGCATRAAPWWRWWAT